MHGRPGALFRSTLQSIFSRIDEYSHFANNLESNVHSSIRQTYPLAVLRRCCGGRRLRYSQSTIVHLGHITLNNINDLCSTTNRLFILHYFYF
jgi:hypothetical protein